MKLEDVELRSELFQNAGLPCEVVRGTVQRLHLRVPWKQLLKQPVVLEATGITLQLREREEGQWEGEAASAREQARKVAALIAEELQYIGRWLGSPGGGSSLSGFYAQLWKLLMGRIQVSISDAHISFQELVADVSGGEAMFRTVGGVTLKKMHTLAESESLQEELQQSEVPVLSLDLAVSELGLYFNADEAPDADSLGVAREYAVPPFDSEVGISGIFGQGGAKFVVETDIEELKADLDERVMALIDRMGEKAVKWGLRARYAQYRSPGWRSGLDQIPEQHQGHTRGSGWAAEGWRYAIKSALLDVREKKRKTNPFYYLQRADWMEAREYIELYENRLRMLVEGTEASGNYFANQMAPAILHVEEERLQRMERSMVLEDVQIFRSIAQMRYEHSAPAPEDASEEGTSDSGSQSWKGWLKWGLSSMKGYVSTLDASHAMAFPPAPSYMSKDDLLSSFNLPLASEEETQEMGAAGSPQCQFTVIVSRGIIGLRHHLDAKPLLLAELGGLVCDFQFRPGTTHVSLTAGGLRLESQERLMLQLSNEAAEGVANDEPCLAVDATLFLDRAAKLRASLEADVRSVEIFQDIVRLGRVGDLLESDLEWHLKTSVDSAEALGGVAALICKSEQAQSVMVLADAQIHINTLKFSFVENSSSKRRLQFFTRNVLLWRERAFGAGTFEDEVYAAKKSLDGLYGRLGEQAAGGFELSKINHEVSCNILRYHFKVETSTGIQVLTPSQMDRGAEPSPVVSGTIGGSLYIPKLGVDQSEPGLLVLLELPRLSTSAGVVSEVAESIARIGFPTAPDSEEVSQPPLPSRCIFGISIRIGELSLNLGDALLFKKCEEERAQINAEFLQIDLETWQGAPFDLAGNVSLGGIEAVQASTSSAENVLLKSLPCSSSPARSGYRLEGFRDFLDSLEWPPRFTPDGQPLQPPCCTVSFRDSIDSTAFKVGLAGVNVALPLFGLAQRLRLPDMPQRPPDTVSSPGIVSLSATLKDTVMSTSGCLGVKDSVALELRVPALRFLLPCASRGPQGMEARCSGLAVCFLKNADTSRCMLEVPNILVKEQREGSATVQGGDPLSLDFSVEVPSIQTDLTQSTLPQILGIVEHIKSANMREESGYRSPQKYQSASAPAAGPLIHINFALSNADLSFLVEEKSSGMSLGIVRLKGGLQVGAGGCTKLTDVSWEIVSLTLQPRSDEFGNDAGVKRFGHLLASVRPKKGTKSTLRLMSIPGKPRAVVVEGLDCTVGCDGWAEAGEFAENVSSCIPGGQGPGSSSNMALEISVRDCQASLLAGQSALAGPTIVLSRPCLIKILPRENCDPDISVSLEQLRLEMPSLAGASRGGRRPLAEISGVEVCRSSGDELPTSCLDASVSSVNMWASHSQLLPISVFVEKVLQNSEETGPSLRDVENVGAGQPSETMSIQVRAKVGKVALLLCDDRYGPAAPLLEAALSGLVGEGVATVGAAAQFTGVLTAELLLDAYSFNKVGWEPVLEPWSFQVEIEAASNHVGVKSCSPLELTLSAAGVEAAALASELIGSILPGATRECRDAPAAQRSASRESPVSKVDPESSPESSVIDEQFVPYWLSNFSGETLEVQLAGSSSGGYGAPHCLEVSSGSSAPLVVRSGSPSEQGRHCVTVGLGSRRAGKPAPLHRQPSLQDLQRSFRTLQLRPARVIGACWSTPVPLEASARCSYAVDSSDGGSMKFVCEVLRRAGGGREVRVRSAFGVRNCTSSSVDIRSPFPGDVEDGGVFRVRLESGKAVWLPAAAGRGGTIFFRPAPGKERFHARWSNPIRLGTGGPRVGDNWAIRCRLDNSGKSQAGWGCCAAAEAAAGAASDTEIVLRPSVEVANGLPVPVRFEIRVEPSFTYKEPPRPLRLLHELDVAPGEQRALPSDLDPAHDLHCRIYLKGYFWSSPVALPVRRQDAEGEEAIGEVWLDREEGGGEKVRLRLLSGGVAGARNVRVVGALALHNHSGVPLEATDSSEKGGSAYWQSVPPLFSKDSPDVGVFASAVEEPLSPTAVKNLGKIGTPEIAASHMRHSLIDALDEPSPITPLRALKSVPESCWPVLFNPTHDNEELTGSDLPDSTALVFRMALGQSGPSRPILMDVPRYTTAVELGTTTRKNVKEDVGLISAEPQRVASAPLPDSVLLAVHVEEGAIHVHPQFMLVNCLPYPIFFRQAATPEALQNFLLPGHSCAIHQQSSELPMLVNFRPKEVGWDWSGSFSPRTPGRTLLKLRNRRGGPSGLVEAHIEERIMDTFRVTLQEYRNVFAPYRVDNCTRSLIGYYQKNCDTEEEFLRPYGSIVYTWDEPTLPHQLVVKLPGHGVLATVLMDDVDYRRKITVPSREDPRIPGNKLAEYNLDLAVSAEGPTRVLTVSDSDVHDTSAQAGTPGSAPPRAARPSKDQPLFALLSSVSVEFKRAGLSIVSERREVLYASVVGAQLEAAVTASKVQFRASVGRLQVDNTLHGTCYPVLLSVPALSGQQKLETRSPSQRRPALVLDIAAWKDTQPGLTCVSNAVVDVAPIDVALDMSHLEALVSLAAHFGDVFQVRPAAHLPPGGSLSRRGGQQAPPGRNRGDSVAVAPAGHSGAEKVYLENLSISPLVLRLSFSTTGWLRGQKEAPGGPREGGGDTLAGPLGKWGGRALLLADMEEAPLSLRGLQLRHALMDHDAAASFVGRHYVRGLLQETYKVLASVSVLGDPLGLARNLGAGVWDFLHIPITGLRSSGDRSGGPRGPRQFTSAVFSGTRSLVSHTLFALSNAAYQMSAAAEKSAMAVRDQCDGVGGALEGSGVPSPGPGAGSGAEPGARSGPGAGSGPGVGAGPRPRPGAGPGAGVPSPSLPPGAGRGAQDGSLLSALARGMVGLVAAPVRGAERGGFRGLVQGVAQGVVGAVAQPTVVLLGLTAQYAKSLRELAARGRGAAARARPPRYMVSGGLLRPYNRVEAVGQNLLQLAAGRRFARETYVFCQELRTPGSFAVLTEEHFLCFKEPFEGAGAGAASARLAFAVPLRDVVDVRRRGARLVALRLAAAPPLLPPPGSAPRRTPRPPEPPFAHAAVISRSEAAGAQLEALLRDQAPRLLA